MPVLGSPSAPGLGSTRLMYQSDLLPHGWGWRHKAARLFVRQTRTKALTFGTYLRRCVFVATRPHTPSQVFLQLLPWELPSEPKRTSKPRREALATGTFRRHSWKRLAFMSECKRSAPLSTSLPASGFKLCTERMQGSDYSVRHPQIGR